MTARRGGSSRQRSTLRGLVVVFLVVLGVPFPSQAQDVSQLAGDFFSDLQYRHIGPVGNRVSAVVGVPGDANIYYFGAASGGVFKTVDGGVHWEPVFDDQPAQSIGALAIDPANSNVVWAGTGEAHIRSNVSIGNGVIRPPTEAEAGPIWGWRKQGGSAASSSIPGIRTSCS